MSATIPEIRCGDRALENFVVVHVSIRRSVQWIPEARVVLQHTKGTKATWWKDCSAVSSQCQPGRKATVHYGGIDIFSGIITEQSVQWQDQELRLVLKHPLQRLVNTLRSQVFRDQDDGQIIARIFKEHEVSYGTLETKTKHQQMIQWDCSDWQFIRSRLAAHAVWLIPKRDKVECRLPVLEGKTHVLYARRKNTKEDPQILDAQWIFNNEMTTEGVSLQYWNVDEQKLSEPPLAAKVKSIASGALDASKIEALNPRLELRQTAWSISGEAQALVNGRQLAQLAVGVQVWLRLQEPEGKGKTTLMYELGDTLELSGFEKGFSGKGVISMLEHQWSRGTWTGIVAVGVPMPQAQDAAGLPRNTRLVVGIVQPYQKDTRGLNRLLVQVPLLDTKQPLWARLASPYASKEAGLCLYPEEGDEVILAFIDDDPRYPLILGSVHNPKNKAPYEPSKENALKGFKYIEQGKERSWLFDVKNGSFNVINDKDSLVFNKEGVRLESQGAITVSAGKDLSAESEGSIITNAKKQMTISSDNALTLKSKQKLMAQGQTQVEIKGAKIDLKN